MRRRFTCTGRGACRARADDTCRIGEHLHMLSYKILNFENLDKNCNHLNTLYINLAYCLLVLPSILVKESGVLCKYWFLSLIIIYLLTYFRLNGFVKKKLIYKHPM